MTCGKNGKSACAELFPEALWVDYIDPGYTLAIQVRNKIAEFAAKQGMCPQMIFLKNHGVFVGADTADEINAKYAHIMSTLDSHYSKHAITEKLDQGILDQEIVETIAPKLRTLLRDPARKTIISEKFFQVSSGPLTPDHIVYAGSFSLATESTTIEADILKFAEKNGRKPLVISIPEKAVFIAGDSLRNAKITADLAQDAALVMKFTDAFGGAEFLSDVSRSFIENWEVESYRKKASSGNVAGRLNGKIAVVTGGAQGFGYGITEGLVKEGATVVIADMNIEGAKSAADILNKQYGIDKVLALEVNISQEASIEGMLQKLLAQCGGLDLFVANAGVLKAGSVKTFDKKDWDFVTNINYTGYYLCVKHVAKIMSLQNASGGDWTDIVQINSKSGLVGSNRNAAYAASKFGTIGQTQSFALELIDDKIKINSVCPGNFFDGPLWSDPEKGLFIQYLNSNKVPGAKNIDDVKQFYEKKVPMGRGCLPEDVVRAIIYCVSQEYETGQAVPVSGGQVMLN